MSLKALSEVSEWENVSPQIIAVGFHLANCANGKTGLSFPSVEYLAKKTSLSPRSVQRILSDMESRKLIRKEYQYGKSGIQKTTNYIFLHENSEKQEGDTHGGGRVTHITPHRGDTHDTHKQELTRKFNQKNIHTPKKPAFILPKQIDSELWTEWMQIRTRLKAINSDRAKNMLITELHKCEDAGISMNKAIETAIGKSWKSINPSWITNLDNNHDNRSASQRGSDNLQQMCGANVYGDDDRQPLSGVSRDLGAKVVSIDGKPTQRQSNAQLVDKETSTNHTSSRLGSLGFLDS